MATGLEIGLNAAMVVLLSATVVYCWVLNRRIQTLQDSRGELAHLLRQFDRSTKRATDAMNLLQTASKEAGKAVQGRIEKAKYVLDDLNYVIDKAAKVAEQMEAGIAIARQREKIEHDAIRHATQHVAADSSAAVDPIAEDIYEVAVPAAAQPAKPVAVAEAQPPTVKALQLEDLHGVSVIESTEEVVISDTARDSIRRSLRQAKAGGKDAPSALSSIQSLLESVAERRQAAEAAALKTAEPTPARRDRVTTATAAHQSRGEQELLRALHMQAE